MFVDTTDKKNDPNGNDVARIPLFLDVRAEPHVVKGSHDDNKAESLLDMNNFKQIAPKLKMNKQHHKRLNFASCLTKLVALKPVEDEA